MNFFKYVLGFPNVAEFCQASGKGDVDTVMAMLKNKVDPNSQGPKGTALHEACRNGRSRMVKLLVENRADVNSRDLTQDTPLHIAAFWQHYDIVEYLLDRNANVNAVELGGNTVLHDAVQGGSNLLIVHALLIAGIEKDKKNLMGQTAVDCAKTAEMAHIIQSYVSRNTEISFCLKRPMFNLSAEDITKWSQTLEFVGATTLGQYGKLPSDVMESLLLPSDVKDTLDELFLTGFALHSTYNRSLKEAHKRKGLTVQTRDGRKLAYAEYGVSDGFPVFYFHGLCGSRLERPPYDDMLEDEGIRLITVDRPGYGESDDIERRTYKQWAFDIEELANHLKIEKFSVIGFSSGGPYALSVASMLPNRLEAVVIVSGDIPYTLVEHPDFELSELNQTLAAMTLAGKWAISTALYFSIAEPARNDPPTFFDSYFADGCEADSSLRTNDAFCKMLLSSTNESCAHGVDAASSEILLERDRWDFSLQDVDKSIILVYGSKDAHFPPKLVKKYLLKPLAESKLYTFRNEGHWSVLVNHWKHILCAAKGDKSQLEMHSRENDSPRSSQEK